MANFWTEQDPKTKLWYWLIDTGYKSMSGYPTRGSAQDSARLAFKHHSLEPLEQSSRDHITNDPHDLDDPAPM